MGLQKHTSAIYSSSFLTNVVDTEPGVVFYVKVYFYMEYEAPRVRMLPDASKKNNFLEILALLHYMKLTNGLDKNPNSFVKLT